MDNKKKLIGLIRRNFDYDIPEELYDKSMFLEPMCINARNFLILFMDVEKEFSIRIPDNLIMERRIDSFNSMLKIIDELTNLNKSM